MAWGYITLYHKCGRCRNVDMKRSISRHDWKRCASLVEQGKRLGCAHEEKGQIDSKRLRPRVEAVGNKGS